VARAGRDLPLFRLRQGLPGQPGTLAPPGVGNRAVVEGSGAPNALIVV
jgi:hypothetical protein